MAEVSPPQDGLPESSPTSEKRISYQDVLEITKKIEKDNGADQKFSLKVARFWDLKRTIRSAIETHSLTQNAADHQVAFLLAGINQKQKEFIENHPTPQGGFTFQTVLNLSGDIKQSHIQDRQFNLNVARFFVLQKVLQSEVTAHRITQDDADHQTAILFAGMNSEIREIVEQKMQVSN